ncbi:hypothetical protein [Aurantibacter aestuarii]|uniref:Uncharacterized protein n=1 Tax=Aurantibacter aestuarii TaxID=1266046 RepID=A0A2T1N9Y2_9FLAO|nr:hypothetical protein [Aurantibacter aestuarii]PSG88687.1 hypothetical protein C7H52_10375 [Aurantibacter aestuarii]
MVQSQKAEHKDLLEQSINHLEHLGYEKIKADLDGFDSPKSFLKKGSDIVVTPDITAYRRSKKYYFELGIKNDETKLLKSKWRFLDVLSRMKNERFKIITKKGHYSFTNQVLDDLNLEKNLIKL